MWSGIYGLAFRRYLVQTSRAEEHRRYNAENDANIDNNKYGCCKNIDTTDNTDTATAEFPNIITGAIFNADYCVISRNQLRNTNRLYSLPSELYSTHNGT